MMGDITCKAMMKYYILLTNSHLLLWKSENIPSGFILGNL